CGWQRLRPESGSFVPYAFIQPNGSWCWSNAGFIASPDGSGLLVDTLMDPVLTGTMLRELGPATGGSAPGRVDAVVFTHPDVDHILGNQAVAPEIPRLGTAKAQQDIDAQAGAAWKLKLCVEAGRFIWQVLKLFGGPSLLPLLPSALQPRALSLLGFAKSQDNLAGFNLKPVEGARLPKFESLLASGDNITVHGQPLPVRFWEVGAIHSKSDSMILLPVFIRRAKESKVAFTGDLLFIGIAPVMWSGPASTWVKALDDLLEATGGDWRFVPGHGPVTDAEGVRSVRRYFAYLHEAVSKACSDLPLAISDADEACAKRVLEQMPQDLKDDFHEPERIMICAVIERMARRAGGSAKVNVMTKLKWIGKMSEHRMQLPAPPGKTGGDEL
ncbi:unnamed protein product, partial [Symbiodinium sp. CCMP2456]